jgi:hypothetical protein
MPIPLNQVPSFSSEKPSQVRVCRCFGREPLQGSALTSPGAEQGGAQGCGDWDLCIRIAETFSIRLVPEFLVGYVRTDSSMSLSGELMEASASVVRQRARPAESALAGGDLSPVRPQFLPVSRRLGFITPGVAIK